MNYGRYGRELLLELKRGDAASTTLDSTRSGAPPLPAYNDELVGNAIQDLRLHVQALQDQAQAASDSGGSGKKKPSMQVRPSILLQNAAIQRNKRCLLAYHVGRLERLKPIYWHQLDPSNTSPAERQFLDAYGALVHEYTKACGLQGDDLRAHGLSVPLPGDRVQVRVVESVGGDDEGVVLNSGACAVLAAGSTHYLLWEDVEEYVRTGQLQVLDNEEHVG